MNKNDKQFIVEKIRTQYMEKRITELDELRALDAKVKRPANIFAYTFGSLAALIMGAGMSLVMTNLGETLGIGQPLITGIVIGVVGMAFAIVNYPIYKAILGSRRKKFADKILALSEKTMER